MAKTSHLHQLRTAEAESCFDLLPRLNPKTKILEIGAGTGLQARLLFEAGFDVSAVDLTSSAYWGDRVFLVEAYDGSTLPFPDDHFDVIFTSNVLEHVAQLEMFFLESRRVLKPGGIMVHIVPTPSWRIWSQIAYYPWLLKRAWQLVFTGDTNAHKTPLAASPRPNFLLRLALNLYCPQHGERGNALDEALYYRRAFWRGCFCANGLQILSESSTGLFYTEAKLLGSQLAINKRKALAKILGSSCRVYVVATDKRA